MTHATLAKFGYPATLLKELEHWCILLRPAQATLGAVVLCSRHEATALADLPPAAFAEMHTAVSLIETRLKAFRPFRKINYLALMMVDPQVHFHVLPRYAEAQTFEGISFPDPGWPALPDLKQAPDVPENVQKKLHAALVDLFARPV